MWEMGGGGRSGGGLEHYLFEFQWKVTCYSVLKKLNKPTLPTLFLTYVEIQRCLVVHSDY